MPCLNALRNTKVFQYFLLVSSIWIDSLGFLFCISHLAWSYLNAKANGFLPKGLKENKAKQCAPRDPPWNILSKKILSSAVFTTSFAGTLQRWARELEANSYSHNAVEETQRRICVINSNMQEVTGVTHYKASFQEVFTCKESIYFTRPVISHFYNLFLTWWSHGKSSGNWKPIEKSLDNSGLILKNSRAHLLGVSLSASSSLLLLC